MSSHYTRLIDSQIALAMSRGKDAEDLIHKGLRGRAREIFIRDLLRPFINPNFGICTGIVVDSSNKQSNQIDIIIYDKSLLPPILLTTEEVRFTNSLEEVLNDEDINCVIIATPAETHYTLTKQCLSNGKNVVKLTEH